jgi:hypothetical protein
MIPYEHVNPDIHYTHLSKEKKTSAISSFNAYLNGRENAQEKVMG